MRIATGILIVITTLFSIDCGAAGVRSGSEPPEVRSPQDGQHIGEAGDPECEPQRPCWKIRTKGWVPSQRTPFLVVAPLSASPNMWIQPLVRGVRADGTFSGLAYLGEAHNGARQYFKIFVFACAAADRFTEGQEIVALPDDCEVSDPVEVYRER